MGCIQVTATLTGKGINPKASVENMVASATRLGLDIHPVVSVNPTTAIATRVGEYLQVGASLVCVFLHKYYVNVSPDIMWLNESNGYSGVFEVGSNTKWIVE